MEKNIQTLVKNINILSHNLKSKNKASSQINGSHGMTLDQSPNSSGEDLTEFLDLTTEYQLTVQIRMKLTRRQIGLLLEVLNYQSVHFGINLGMYLAMEHLSSLLIGQKSNNLEIKDENERRCVSVTQICLMSIGNKTLTSNSLLMLPEPVQQGLIENELIMDRRTFGSRYAKWRPEEFLLIRAVPLNIQFERIKGNSERYSSYCKGYGESHPSAHRQKTKPSSELDGNTEDIDYVNLTQISNLLILTQLEMRAKFLRKYQKS